jgi:hypothetical protein
VNVAEGTIETRKRQFVFYTPIFCIQSTNIGLPEYSLLLLPFSDMGPRAHGLFLGQAGFLRKPGRAQARGPLSFPFSCDHHDVEKTRDANKCANARFAFYFDAFYTYFILKSRV